MKKDNMKVISDQLERLTLHACMLLCAAMLIVASAHVLWRYLFNSALSWSEEFLRFTLVWFSFLVPVSFIKGGAIWGLKFRDMLPSKARVVIKRVLTYIEIIGTIATTIIGVMLVMRSQGQITPALHIPYAIPYISIPLGFLIMTYYGIEHAVREMKGIDV